MRNNVVSLATRELLDTGRAERRVRSVGANALQADTPPLFPIPNRIEAFCCDELGCVDVRHVQILPDENASERVMDNVAASIAKQGGEALPGWKITESELFVRADFHVVVKDGAGIYDPTPITNRALICFAADPSVPEDFDFSKRPGPVSISKYAPLTRSARVGAALAAMTPDLEEATRRRAEHSNLSIEDLLALEVGEDRLDVAITQLLECTDQLGELEIRTRERVTQTGFEAFTLLARRKRALEAIVVAELDQRARQAKTKRR